MSIIQVEDVSMRFNLAQEKTETLKEYTVKLLKHQLFFNEFYALRDISFKIEPGESVALIGRNGSGKSTLMNVLYGLAKPDGGTITVNGIDIQKDPIACKKIMAYIPDNPDLYEFLTGYEYLNFVADMYLSLIHI
mgnify:CR=1 FL=1